MTAKRSQALATIVTNPQSTQPLMLAANLPTGYIGVPWTGSVWGVGGSGGNVYSSITVPAWATANTVTILGIPVVQITGTPTSGTRGSQSVTVTVTDSSSTVTTKQFRFNTTYTIAGAGGQLSINAVPPPAYTNNPYSLDVKTYLSNPTVPLTSTVVSTGTLPTGMSVSSSTNGIISAASVTGTTQNVVVTVTDGAGQVVDLHLQFRVKPGLSASTYAPAGVLGQPYQGKVTVSGGSGLYSIKPATANPLPSGLSVTPNSGDISGQLTAFTSANGIATTHFVITDLVTGESITTTLGTGSAAIAVNSGIPATANFGNGADGDIVIDGTNTYSFCTLSGGINTLQRDVCARNVTITGSGKLAFAGRLLRWTDTFDLSNASAGAICNSATGASWGMAAGTRGVGTTTNGTNGTAATAPTYWCGGKGSQGGNGGHGDSTNAGGSSPVPTDAVDVLPQTIFDSFLVCQSPSFTTAPVRGGGGGSGGGGGGGNGSLAGGNGGTPGDGGDIVRMIGRTLKTGVSTPAAVIDVGGVDGGDGSNATGIGNKGGGGAAGAGGGGEALIAYSERLGPTIANAINADGGDGGDGGIHTGSSPATDGVGAAGAEGGNIVVIDLTQGITTVTKGAAGAFNSGRIGGLGGQCRASL